MSEQETTGWSAQVAAIYETQGRELWALFYAQCSDADRAYDALQESFLRLQQQNGTQIQDVRAWLLQVGRNWLRDVARRQRVAAKSSEHLDSVAGRAGEPITSLRESELHEQVRAGLDQLRPDDREVLVLRYALGWSSIRMAEVLGSTPPAIDMRLSRARRRLADILNEMGISNEQG